MREVLQLERNVVKLGAVAADEVDGVVIGVAAQEDEEVADPVGHAKAQNTLIERGGLLRARHDEGDVTELQGTGAEHLFVAAEIAPFLEQLDGGALVVFEGENLSQAGNGVVALLALDAVPGEYAGKFIEVGARRDLERQLGAATVVALFELDDQLADLGGEEGAFFFARGNSETVDLRVIDDGLF